LLNEGRKDLLVFHLEAEAVQWVNQPLDNRRGPAPHVIRCSAEGAGGPSRGLPGVAHAAGTDRSARGYVVVSAMGNDPSIGDPTRVYNTLVTSRIGMNQALCPDGMSDDDQGGLYNNMMDIAALPGMSKKSDGAASTDMALLTQMLGSSRV
jgi:hypothetical protein